MTREYWRRTLTLKAHGICEWPECDQPIAEFHEPLRRGNATKDKQKLLFHPANMIGLCRVHHEQAHMFPSEKLAIRMLVLRGRRTVIEFLAIFKKNFRAFHPYIEALRAATEIDS